MDDEPIDPATMTPWGVRATQTIQATAAARRAVTMLRGLALAIIVIVFVGAVLVFTTNDFSPRRYLIGNVLLSLGSPLGFAGILLALSYVLDVYANKVEADVFYDGSDQDAG